MADRLPLWFWETAILPFPLRLLARRGPGEAKGPSTPQGASNTKRKATRLGTVGQKPHPRGDEIPGLKCSLVC